MRASMVASLSSTLGRGGGLYGATEVSIRGEYNRYSWAPSGGEAPLSRWFSAEGVLVLASSVILIFPGWVKGDIGWTITSISSSETLCINSSSRMWTASSDVLDEFVGDFLGESKNSYFPSLSPELATNVMSPSGPTGNLGVAA